MRWLALTLMLSGCATPEIVVTYEQDRFGVPVPVINGDRYAMTDAERLVIAQSFVTAYCPVAQ